MARSHWVRSTLGCTFYVLVQYCTLTVLCCPVLSSSCDGGGVAGFFTKALSQAILVIVKKITRSCHYSLGDLKTKGPHGSLQVRIVLFALSAAANRERRLLWVLGQDSTHRLSASHGRRSLHVDSARGHPTNHEHANYATKGNSRPEPGLGQAHLYS